MGAGNRGGDGEGSIAMTFQEAIRTSWQNYSNFGDRSGREEFWYFILFQVLLEVAFYIVVVLVPFLAILGLGFLALIIPTLAVAARRLHDTGRPAWNLVVLVVPLVGVVYMIYAAVQPSSPPNDWGRGPLPPAGRTRA